MPIQPTPELYTELQQAFEHFNATLFDGLLPDCLITLQRERRTYGYFSSARFVRRSGERTDEIAMNPGYFGIRTIKDTLSTLAHEMVHMWQCHHGEPGRRGYHNHQWARRMEAIGLMPSDTGEAGGRKVGEKVAHYIVPGGRFDVSCTELLTRKFALSWLDRFPPECPRSATKPSATGRGFIDDVDDGRDDEGSEDGELAMLGALVEMPPTIPLNRSNRVKYRCPKCVTQVWGKPGIAILCGGEYCGGAAFQPQLR